tara:strand:+ start:105 stop:236 length:132 start_codon:yes stop_codon:yes gene_type:complete
VVFTFRDLSNIPAEIEVVLEFLNLKNILAPHFEQKPLFAFLED